MTTHSVSELPASDSHVFCLSLCSCFISHTVVFFASLLGPIASLLVVTLAIFLIALCIIIGYSTKRFKGSKKASKRRGACRSIFGILGVMFLFGLTWVFGAFTIGGGPDYFKYLFVGFNSLQGLFIFVFFVVFAKESQDLWLQTCGCKERKKRKTFMSAITGIAPPKRDRLGLDEDADRLKPMEEINLEARLGMSSFDIMYAVQPSQFDVLLHSNSSYRAGNVARELEEPEEEEPALPMTSEENRKRGEALLEQEKKELESIFSEPKSYSQDQRSNLQERESSSLERESNSQERESRLVGQGSGLLSEGSLCPATIGHSPTHSLDSTQNVLECMSMADSGILVDKRTSPPLQDLQHPQSGSTPRHVHSVSGIGYISAESSMEMLPQTEEDCYINKNEPITLASSLRPRAVPNEYTTVNVENPYP